MDNVRIWWEKREAFGGDFWEAFVDAGVVRTHLFHSFDRDEFFRRYNTIAVEKATAEEA